MSKKFKFDICVCGHSFKDIIYEIDDFPKENSNKSYNAVVSYKFGGVFNTLRALRFLAYFATVSARLTSRAFMDSLAILILFKGYS